MAITFDKMHGLGNDFVVLDLRNQVFHVDKQVAVRLADRHTGIGCDQLLVLRKPTAEGTLASFEIWNADGSKAEQCGNGVRCLGLYLHNRSETPAGQFTLSGPAGIVKIECLAENQVQVDMGAPIFDPLRVPLLVEAVNGWYSLEIDQQAYRLGAASMGNPHALMIVDDIDTTDVAKLGAAISTHPVFPQGSNAGFVEIIKRNHIRLRVFERGAAETRACGSGACAAMCILHRAGLVGDTVSVTQSGGNLIISWTGGEKHVIMEGSATQVFKGTLT